MAQGFLNMEAEGLDKVWRPPPALEVSSTSRSCMCPRLAFSETARESCLPPAPLLGSLPGTQTSGPSVHKCPTPQCTSPSGSVLALDVRWTFCLPGPGPCSLRGLNMERGLGTAGRREDEATGDLVPVRNCPSLCMLIGITISLWASVSSPISLSRL